MPQEPLQGSYQRDAASLPFLPLLLPSPTHLQAVQDGMRAVELAARESAKLSRDPFKGATTIIENLDGRTQALFTSSRAREAYLAMSQTARVSLPFQPSLISNASNSPGASAAAKMARPTRSTSALVTNTGNDDVIRIMVSSSLPPSPVRTSVPQPITSAGPSISTHAGLALSSAIVALEGATNANPIPPTSHVDPTDESVESDDEINNSQDLATYTGDTVAVPA